MTQVLSMLRQRNEHGEEGLSNAEIRQITRLDQYQAVPADERVAARRCCGCPRGRGDGEPLSLSERSERSLGSVIICDLHISDRINQENM